MSHAEKLNAAKSYLAARGLDPSVMRRGGSAVLTRHFNGMSVRRFDAAAMNRLTASWVAADLEINDELRGDLDAIRARSRDAGRNHEYARKFLRMVQANVVGSKGFTLQSKIMDAADTTDTEAAGAVESSWSAWSEKGVCEISGRMDFVTLCRSLMIDLPRDGEYLVRIVTGAAARNDFGFALQRLDVSRIDTNLNRAAMAGQNAIVMGVEIDDAGRTVNVYLKRRGITGGWEHDIIPGRDIIHDFMPFEPEQVRGLPWMHAALRRMNDLNGYREAAVIAARVGASKMGFYTVNPDADPDQLAEGYQADGVPFTSSEPAEFGVLPSGIGFQPYDPAYPHEQFDAFCKASLRGISSAIGVSYNGLANDLEGVNFSSIRSGVQDERDEWMVIQNWFISSFLRPVFLRWLSAALARQQIRLANGSPLPLVKFDKFKAHQWQPRRWAWVDPLKDVQATLKEVGNGLDTLTDACARKGIDLEDVLATKAREKKLMEKYGVTMDPKAVAAMPIDNAGGGNASAA